MRLISAAEAHRISASMPPSDQALAHLRRLAGELVVLFEDDPRDPFASVHERQLAVDDAALELLRDRVVLISGGEGFVGDGLVAAAADGGARRVITVDSARGSDGSQTRHLRGDRVPVIRYCVDTRDRSGLERVFDRERPGLVFHLAAQRLPGLAEIQVHRSLSTNLVGTQNTVELSNDYGVGQVVVASTGKAAQYLATDIYAGSKKLAEWWLAATVSDRDVPVAAVRFTHIVENSPVAGEIDAKVRDGLLTLHEPDRFIVAQSIGEAHGLLLNALRIAEPSSVRLFAVRHLSCPVNVMQIAVHELRQAKAVCPILFMGLPRGYARTTFQGQFDWDSDHGVTPMLNVLELREASFDDAVVVAKPAAVEPGLVLEAFETVEEALNGDRSDPELARIFASAARRVTAGSFACASPDLIEKILQWGCSSSLNDNPSRSLEEHAELVGLLTAALARERDQQGATVDDAVFRVPSDPIRSDYVQP